MDETEVAPEHEHRFVKHSPPGMGDFITTCAAEPCEWLGYQTFEDVIGRPLGAKNRQWEE